MPPARKWANAVGSSVSGPLALLRQYFAKGTDLSVYGPEDLEHVAQELNGRPRTMTPEQSAAGAQDRPHLGLLPRRPMLNQRSWKTRR